MSLRIKVAFINSHGQYMSTFSRADIQFPLREFGNSPDVPSYANENVELPRGMFDACSILPPRKQSKTDESSDMLVNTLYDNHWLINETLLTIGWWY